MSQIDESRYMLHMNPYQGNTLKALFESYFGCLIHIQN